MAASSTQAPEAERGALSDWPKVRSTDGTRLHNWGVNPVVPFTIPYTVSYEDGAKASWIEVEDVTFTATQSGRVTYLQRPFRTDGKNQADQQEVRQTAGAAR